PLHFLPAPLAAVYRSPIPTQDRPLAGPAAQHAEEALDVRVRADVAVAVEVGGAAACAAVPAQTCEERLDVRVGADIPVSVEVGGPARRAGPARDVVRRHAALPRG